MGKSKRISKRSKTTSVMDREVRRKVEANILKVLREKAQSSEGAILVNDEEKMERPTENQRKFENATGQDLSDSTPESKDATRKKSRYDKDSGVLCGRSDSQKHVHGERITRNRLTRDTGLFGAGMKSEKIVRALPHDEVMREIARVSDHSDAVSRVSASGEPAHEKTTEFSREVPYKEATEQLQKAIKTSDKRFEKELRDRLKRAFAQHEWQRRSQQALAESRDDSVICVDSRSPSPQLMPLNQHLPKERVTTSLAHPPYRPSSSENEESPYPNLVNMPNITDNLEQTYQRPGRFHYTDCGAESATGLSHWLNASNLRKATGHDFERYLQPVPKVLDEDRERETYRAFDGVERYSEGQRLDFLTSTEGENHRLQLDVQQEEESQLTPNDSAVEMLKRNSFLSRITSVCDKTDDSSDESVSPPSLSGEGRGLQGSGQHYERSSHGSRRAEVLSPHYSDNTLLHGYGPSEYQRRRLGLPAHETSPLFGSVSFPRAQGVSTHSMNSQSGHRPPLPQVASDSLTSDFYTSYFRRGLSFRMDTNTHRELPVDLSTFRTAWTSRDEGDDIEVTVKDDNHQRNMSRASGDHLSLEDKVRILVDSEDDDDVEMIGYDVGGEDWCSRSRRSGDNPSLDYVNSHSMQRRLHLPPLRRPCLESPSPRNFSPHKLY